MKNSARLLFNTINLITNTSASPFPKLIKPREKLGIKLPAAKFLIMNKTVNKKGSPIFIKKMIFLFLKLSKKFTTNAPVM